MPCRNNSRWSWQVRFQKVCLEIFFRPRLVEQNSLELQLLSAGENEVLWTCSPTKCHLFGIEANGTGRKELCTWNCNLVKNLFKKWLCVSWSEFGPEILSPRFQIFAHAKTFFEFNVFPSLDGINECSGDLGTFLCSWYREIKVYISGHLSPIYAVHFIAKPHLFTKRCENGRGMSLRYAIPRKNLFTFVQTRKKNARKTKNVQKRKVSFSWVSRTFRKAALIKFKLFPTAFALQGLFGDFFSKGSRRWFHLMQKWL